MIRTNAIPDDFPHLLAWFGQVPDFQWVGESKKFHCRDEWFKLRQVVDMRYYANFVYTEHNNYTVNLIMNRIEDVSVCRKIRKIANDADRIDAYTKWYVKRRKPVNDVWQYHSPPKTLR